MKSSFNPNKLTKAVQEARDWRELYELRNVEVVAVEDSNETFEDTHESANSKKRTRRFEEDSNTRMRTIDEQTKSKLIKLVKDEGYSLQKAAKMLRIGVATAKLIVKLYKREAKVMSRILQRQNEKKMEQQTQNYTNQATTIPPLRLSEQQHKRAQPFGLDLSRLSGNQQTSQEQQRLQVTCYANQVSESLCFDLENNCVHYSYTVSSQSMTMPTYSRM